MIAKGFDVPFKIAQRCACGGSLRDIFFGDFIAECTYCGKKYDPYEISEN